MKSLEKPVEVIFDVKLPENAVYESRGKTKMDRKRHGKEDTSPFEAFVMPCLVPLTFSFFSIIILHQSRVALKHEKKT